MRNCFSTAGATHTIVGGQCRPLTKTDHIHPTQPAPPVSVWEPIDLAEHQMVKQGPLRYEWSLAVFQMPFTPMHFRLIAMSFLVFYFFQIALSDREADLMVYICALRVKDKKKSKKKSMKRKVEMGRMMF